MLLHPMPERSWVLSPPSPFQAADDRVREELLLGQALREQAVPEPRELGHRGLQDGAQGHRAQGSHRH